jgi:predicted phage baseplate assembly protein
LTAKLVANNKQFNVPIVSDSTEGLFKTGVLLLDLDNVPESPREFTIELRAPNGFPRPPRVVRIDPNVVPIQQGYRISGELHEAQGTPDWSFALNVPGLRFESSEEPVTVSVAGPKGLQAWRRCERLSDQGPNDEVYELDLRTNEIIFGNGINGRMLPAETQVTANYSVSAGAAGGVARNRKWSITGVEGTYGVNPDPLAGGSGSFGWIEQRREARRRSRNDHALVSSDDIREQALALTLLEVARAWVVGQVRRHHEPES